MSADSFSDADHARIEFSMPTVDAEERFVREYATDAVERLGSHPACDRFIYVRVGHAPSVDGGLAVVDVYGDPDAVVEHERDTWDELVADGVLTGWGVTDLDLPATLTEEIGERGAESTERTRHLACRLSPLVFETFAEPPDPVDTFPDEPDETGWWLLPHILSNHQGYTLEAETDAYVRAIQNNLQNVARATSRERATDRLDDVIAALESVRDDLPTDETG